jgi:2,4-dienoyl-CoA reductase-like NADH-dependent reductase (Old Yellow Enzyme family)/thioredoxin reductase
MVTNYSDDGFVTERLKEYYAARARGGVGLVITEACCVDAPVGKETKGELRIDHDRYVPGLADLASAVRRNGAKIVLQLHHAGAQTTSSITGVQPVGPSPIAFPTPGSDTPRELSAEEVGDIVLRFARAAQRAQRAGFDGVEIHGGHFYLFAEFLTPVFNKRSDVYGGGIEGRARFLIETIRAIIEMVGRSYPVLCRIDAYNPLGDVTSEEMQHVARMVQDAGVDGIDATVLLRMTGLGPLNDPEGNLVHFVEAIKKAVTVPVMGGGGLGFLTADRAIGEGRVDLITFGRQSLADPDFAQKLASGKPEEIRPCIACMNCVDSVLNTEGSTKLHDGRLLCAVNPALGRESECVIQRVDKPRKVLVIGGGPAGMEAARVSALRGHHVMLYERAPKLGGQLILASVPPNKKAIEILTEYQRTQLSKLRVSVHEGQDIDSEFVCKAKPDVVILAAGARPAVPQIPGVDRSNVVTALEVLAGQVETGNTVAVIGAELVGCETANFLADKGKKVTLMRRGEEVATKMPWIPRMLLIGELFNKNVTILTGLRYVEINDRGVVITNKEGEMQLVEANTVVLAAGSTPNTELRDALERKCPELHLIGDCKEPRNIMSAIAEGFFTALNT